MKSSKIQVPNPKEAPSSKLQVVGAVALEKNGASASDWGSNGKGADHSGFSHSRAAESEKYPFDFEERPARFGENIVRFSKRIPRNPTNDRLIDQLVGAATSVGANYCEANESASAKDFRYIITRCLKEAKETWHFLRMVAASGPGMAPEAREFWREATELIRILSTMKGK
ncbi:MAG: four helix bundle protein [Proteobacteria bacterium]|nr:four helix bundle protein [Pseudomonadota bacterium]